MRNQQRKDDAAIPIKDKDYFYLPLSQNEIEKLE